jgi:hypothetical protein
VSELVSWVPAAVSAAISVAGAAASTVLWFRARSERREAARQAKLAADAAVASESHLARIADAQIEQHETATARLTAEERDPWQLHRGDNEATLYNDTSTPKYNVSVELRVDDQLWNTDEFAYVGPRRQTDLQRYTDVAAPMSATITWHLLEDCSDTIPPQIIT